RRNTMEPSGFLISLVALRNSISAYADWPALVKRRSMRIFLVPMVPKCSAGRSLAHLRGATLLTPVRRLPSPCGGGSLLPQSFEKDREAHTCRLPTIFPPAAGPESYSFPVLAHRSR